MTCSKRKNYGVFPVVGTILIILLIGLPMFLFGMTAFVAFFKAINTPIIGGMVPMWMVIVGGLIIFKMIRR